MILHLHIPVINWIYFPKASNNVLLVKILDWPHAVYEGQLTNE